MTTCWIKLFLSGFVSCLALHLLRSTEINKASEISDGCVAKQQKMLQSWRPSKSLWGRHHCLLFLQRPQGRALILHPLSLISCLYLLALEWNLKILEGLKWCLFLRPTELSAFFNNNNNLPSKSFSLLSVYYLKNNKISLLLFLLQLNLSCI